VMIGRVFTDYLEAAAKDQISRPEPRQSASGR
jgi:hypothetical protein